MVVKNNKMVVKSSKIIHNKSPHPETARGGSSSRSTSFLNLILVFLLGIVIGQLQPSKTIGSRSVSSNLYADCNAPSLTSSSGSSSPQEETTILNPQPPPKPELETPSSSSTTNSLAEQHQMTWTMPSDLQRIRHIECDGGRKISSTGGFCLTNSKTIGGNQMYDQPLAEYFANHIFAGRTVVDLGAGLGHYGKIFQAGQKVKEWVGYDGAMNVQEQTEGLVRFMDLTQPHASDERPCVGADWAMSLEVAEHIPVEHTDAFLRNVRCRARIGAVISWGRPEQTGGLGHVNTRTEADAIAAVERWGFTVDWDLTKGARAAATLSHFTKTVVVYRLAGATAAAAATSSA